MNEIVPSKAIIYTPGICPYCNSNKIKYKKEIHNRKYLKIPIICKECGKKSKEIHYTEYCETVGYY